MRSMLFGLMAVAILAFGIRKEQLPRYFHSQLQHDEEANACFPALFSFGSSVADTGALDTALPFSTASSLPYGVTYFGKPSKRYCDGRLHIDFWATSLRFPLLDPYLRSVNSYFRRGANFAVAGATARNVTPFCPFPLSIQLNQFREFKSDVIALIKEDPGSSTSTRQNQLERLPKEDYFSQALYVIAIGGNDILSWLLIDKLTPQEIELRVAEVSQSILRLVEELHAEGARNILVEDIFPQGCIPLVLTYFAEEYADQLDSAGCLKPFNALVQLHNSLLKQGVVKLREQLKSASIAVIDTYSKRYDIIANYGKYGFEVPHKACCGTGGEYNFRQDCSCGQSRLIDGQTVTATLCDNVSSHIFWDGVHFTDAVNGVTMRSILLGNHFVPSFNLTSNSCDLADI